MMAGGYNYAFFVLALLWHVVSVDSLPIFGRGRVTGMGSDDSMRTTDRVSSVSEMTSDNLLQIQSPPAETSSTLPKLVDVVMPVVEPALFDKNEQLIQTRVKRASKEKTSGSSPSATGDNASIFGLIPVTLAPPNSMAGQIIEKIDFGRLEELCRSQAAVKRTRNIVGGVLANRRRPKALLRTINKEVSPLAAESALCSFLGALGRPGGIFNGIDSLLGGFLPFKKPSTSPK